MCQNIGNLKAGRKISNHMVSFERMRKNLAFTDDFLFDKTNKIVFKDSEMKDDIEDKISELRDYQDEFLNKKIKGLVG